MGMAACYRSCSLRCAKVQEVAAAVRARGLEASTEHRVLTPDGCKSYRYVDLVGKDARGNVVEMHQVGRQTGAGKSRCPRSPDS